MCPSSIYPVPIIVYVSACVYAHMCAYMQCVGVDSQLKHLSCSTILICVCVRARMHAHAQSTCRYGHMWTSDDNFWELVLFSTMGSRDWTQVIRLWGGFYLLSHLIVAFVLPHYLVPIPALIPYPVPQPWRLAHCPPFLTLFRIFCTWNHKI